MNDVAVIRRLHEHRAWVNARILAAAEALSDEQLRQIHPIGQGSIWKSLVHLYAAEFVWLEAMQGNESPVIAGDLPGQLPGNQLGTGGLTSLADLQREWSILDGRWKRYLSELTPESLDETVVKISTSSGLGKRFTNRRIDILLHVCTHAQYTTAQIANMLRQSGHQPPDVMLITLARGME
jgi:uncharacterized damage-inducible protein DinB